MISGTEGCHVSNFQPEEFAAYLNKALNFGIPTQGAKDIAHLSVDAIAKKIVDIYNQLIQK